MRVSNSLLIYRSNISRLLRTSNELAFDWLGISVGKLIVTACYQIVVFNILLNSRVVFAV